MSDIFQPTAQALSDEAPALCFSVSFRDKDSLALREGSHGQTQSEPHTHLALDPGLQQSKYPLLTDFTRHTENDPFSLLQQAIALNLTPGRHVSKSIQLLSSLISKLGVLHFIFHCL